MAQESFVISTEQGRVKGRTSFMIFKKLSVINKSNFALVGESSYPTMSNKGAKAEIIAKLVELKELPEEAIGKDGYPDYGVFEENAHMLIIESKGLNYFSLV